MNKIGIALCFVPGLAVAAAVAGITYYNQKTHVPLRVESQVDGCTQPVVLTTVASLEQRHDRWSMDDYRLRGDYVSIWIANGDYGLRISTTDRGFSGFEGFTPECRRVLYRSVQKWNERAITERLD